MPKGISTVQNHLRVETRCEAGVTVLAVMGELDLASSPVLEEELERAAATQTELVVVDLSAVEFMDSTGLSVIVKANQRACSGGQRFGLVNGSHQVSRLLSITGATGHLTVVDSAEELLNVG